MSSDRKRIVIDTSSLVAACLYPARLPAQIFKQAILRYQLVASPATKYELKTVLERAKFDRWRTLDERMTWANLYFGNTQVVIPTEHVADCRDPKDNMFLDLALAAKASVIVCSDDDLQTLHPYRKEIEILSLQNFKIKYLDDL